MSILVATLQGRFGNQTMQWLFAYAFALKHGLEFQCDEWIGERVFALPEYKRPWAGASRCRVNEIAIFDTWRDDRNANWNYEKNEPGQMHDLEFRGYAQSQRCMIYTKRQAQIWLKLRPEIETACANAVMASHAKDAKVVLHWRGGDYHGYGYPTVSNESYRRACEHFGLKWSVPETWLLTEESPIPHQGHLPDDLGFMPDFYRMMTAPTLLRGNSSFSWLAALLGDGLVLSPIVDGLEGGKQHDCAFVAGNWPKFAPHQDFVTDLFVNEK